MLQDLTFESTDLAQFERVLAVATEVIACEHLFRSKATDQIWQYPSHAAAHVLSFLGRPPLELARWRPPSDRPAPHYLPVCRFSRNDEPRSTEELVASGHENVLRAAITLVRAADLQAFEAATGEGPFGGCDGTVGIGYRLHGGALSRDLLVTLCHVYHPK